VVYALASFHIHLPPLRKGHEVVFVGVNRNFRPGRDHDRRLLLLYDGGTLDDIAMPQLVPIIAWRLDKPAQSLEIDLALAFQGPGGVSAREGMLGQHERAPPPDHPQFKECNRRWQARISPAI